MTIIAPTDPESIDRAGAAIDLPLIGIAIRSLLTGCWVRCCRERGDCDELQAELREVVNGAIRDVGSTAGFLAILSGKKPAAAESPASGRSRITKREENAVRKAVCFYWSGLPKQRRVLEALNDELVRF